MKQERIEELLKGTKYADKTTTIEEEVDIEARSISIHTIVAGEHLLHFDAALNAARVQVLAKALYQARAELAREGCEQEVKAIDAALAEAGLTKEGK